MTKAKAKTAPRTPRIEKQITLEPGPITEDSLLLLPESMEEELAIPLDDAIDAACAALKLPVLGGPSGSGWSKYKTAQHCPHLFKATYLGGANGKEKTHPTVQLQVGGLMHALMAFYYAYGLGQGRAFYRNRGLCAPEIADRIRGRKAKSDFVEIPPDAADKLLLFLHGAADPSLDRGTVPTARPSLSMILEGERIFDAHTNFYGQGNEDLEPLAVEWFAAHPLLGYTCRYDMIARLGPMDPFVTAGYLEAGSVVIIEHKSSKWLNQWAREGWFLDGEILGQLLLWEASGMAKLFGPLAGLLVDIVTKEKVAKYERVFVSKNPATVNAYERGIQYQNAEFALWQATSFYPRRLVSCWSYGRKCGLYEECRSDAANELAMGAPEIDLMDPADPAEAPSG